VHIPNEHNQFAITCPRENLIAIACSLRKFINVNTVVDHAHFCWGKSIFGN